MYGVWLWRHARSKSESVIKACTKVLEQSLWSQAICSRVALSILHTKLQRGSFSYSGDPKMVEKPGTWSAC